MMDVPVTNRLHMPKRKMTNDDIQTSYNIFVAGVEDMSTDIILESIASHFKVDVPLLKEYFVLCEKGKLDEKAESKNNAHKRLLTDEQIHNAYDKYKNDKNITMQHIADEYGVSLSVIKKYFALIKKGGLPKLDIKRGMSEEAIELAVKLYKTTTIHGQQLADMMGVKYPTLYYHLKKRMGAEMNYGLTPGERLKKNKEDLEWEIRQMSGTEEEKEAALKWSEKGMAELKVVIKPQFETKRGVLNINGDLEKDKNKL